MLGFSRLRERDVFDLFEEQEMQTLECFLAGKV